MLLMFIITSILYVIMIYAVLSLYYKYRKDIEEIENRIQQFEKRVCFIDIDKLTQFIKSEIKVEIMKQSFYDEKQLPKEDEIVAVYTRDKLTNSKEVFDMACGTKGRPRGRRTTSRGGGRGK